MNKYILNILLMFLSLCLFCCKDNIEKKFLENAIEQLKIDKQYEWVIVLPGVGCHGCIQEAEFFMKENISNDKVLFVLTSISSIKILQQKIGLKISDYSNVYIDRNNQFKLSTDNTIYPCVIQVKDGKLLQYTFQSPQTSAFHSLEKYL